MGILPKVAAEHRYSHRTAAEPARYAEEKRIRLESMRVVPRHIAVLQRSRDFLFAKERQAVMKELNKIFSKIVFWDVMPMDYDSRLTANDVFENVRQFVRPGSVVVFHDSLKAFDRLQTALPRTIEELLSKNYTFASYVA